MNRTSKLVIAIATLASAIGIGGTASADTAWQYHHPRQHEVLAREHHQIARIDRERRNGEISGREARHMRQGDRRIAMRERHDARRNGGYITRGEQHRLNERLNHESRRIGN